MKIKELIEKLNGFSDDWQIHIRTVPDDISQPLKSNLIRVVESVDTRGGEARRERPLLMITAYIKEPTT